MFGDLNELRSRPIPSLDSIRATKQRYRDLPIDEKSALLTEPLMRAETFGIAGQNYYARDRNPPYWARAEGAIDALLVRKSVGERLAAVDARLKREDLRLFLFDAWRPRAVQAYFHDVWTPAEIRRRKPELSESEIVAEVQRYWAAPSESPLRPAPHATGAAVDMTIVLDDGQPLWMGGLFDDASALSHTDRFERDFGADFSFSDEEARANRRLLYWLMIEGGFANHPDEWWHYSYGDQMWAALTRAPAAFYGGVEFPPPFMGEVSRAQLATEGEPASSPLIQSASRPDSSPACGGAKRT